MEYQLIKSFPQNYSLLEKIFSNRGVEDIQHYLNTTDNDIPHYSQLTNIYRGVEMLISHIEQNHKILVQVDSDADGYTSGALIVNYLYCLFPDFVRDNLFYRIHTGKQHGIIPSTIPEGVKLVIAPDSSSNDYEEHRILYDKGIDVLVIDHHEADKLSEFACVINNQLCDYPTKSLSGVGMVYKFCCALDDKLNVNYANQFLDLVAVGMVADMMDLRDYETHHLVKKGLDNIRNPYLEEMTKAQSYSINKNGGLNPFTVSFYIAPMINATIRVGSQEEKLMLFESMIDYRGIELIPSTKRGCKGQLEKRAEQACRNCTNIKNRQTKARDASLDVIERIIEDQGLLSHKILTIKLEPDYAVDKNITGLVANILMSKYQRPVLLLNRVENWDTGKITWEGSARGYDKSKFDNFRGYMENSPYAIYAQGHASAFGAGITDEDFQSFIAESDSDLKDFDFNPCYKVDAIFQSDDFKPSEILQVADLKSIWGQGIEEPMIAIENISVNGGNVQLLSPNKNPTLKITLPNGVSLMKFKSSAEEYEKLYSELGCVKINIVGKCERNEWNGIVKPQIIIESYEIVDSMLYYF